MLFKYAPDPDNAGGGIGVMEFNYVVLALFTTGFTKKTVAN